MRNKKYENLINWKGTEGSFKFAQPDKVAQMWGARINKANMTYERLRVRSGRHY